MIVHLRRSTIEIAGREFPAVCGICPLHEGTPGDTDCDRMLGGPSIPVADKRFSYQAMIPMENGALAVVEWWSDQTDYTIVIYSVSCYQDQLDPDGPLWLPHSVALCNGGLLAESRSGRRRFGVWEWNKAEPDWTIEHIERLSTLSFIPPPGPRMRLISLAEADRIWKEHGHHANHSH